MGISVIVIYHSHNVHSLHASQLVDMEVHSIGLPLPRLQALPSPLSPSATTQLRLEELMCVYTDTISPPLLLLSTPLVQLTPLKNPP